MKSNPNNAKLINDALSMLKIEHLSLGIFDQSLPSFPDEDIGRGSPYSNGGKEFLHFARDLGFTTIQFGPQGKTTRADLSPYNSTIFSKNPLSISFSSLNEKYPDLCSSEIFMHNKNNESVETDHIDTQRAWDTIESLSTITFDCFRNGLHHKEISERITDFQRTAENGVANWIEHDALYEALSLRYKTDDWRFWSPTDQSLFASIDNDHPLQRQRKDEIKSDHSYLIERYLFCQTILHEQHKNLRNEANRIGLKIHGDLQIGFSHQDIWSWRALFLPGYLMGAPPSRSNPEGQPWGYPVLNPSLLFSENVPHGPALDLVQARIDNMFTEFDGIRIDHPHGLVCPWVYKSTTSNPLQAVQQGTRLYSSPNITDHPELSKYSIVSPGQLNSDPTYARHGDNWVQNLTPLQLNRYATLIDLIIERAHHFGVNKEDILSEVLSTWPYPLKQVMRERGLGRFCVTQKADPFNKNDIYRRENTAPQDWIMTGNHDTKPIWLLADEQFGSPWYNARARCLCEELGNTEQEKAFLLAAILSDPDKFCEAMFAELFLGPARHVFIFFTDLFGIKKIYNRPGVINSDNWSLRLTPNYKVFYDSQRKNEKAFDINKSLSIALRTRFPNKPDATALADKLINYNYK